MTDRSGLRKSRRHRKWYRPPRFNNRSSSKRSGRIPPSVKANVEEIIRVVKKTPLPISRIYVEDVLIDIAKLNNPELQGKEYQESNRLDENLRLATLMRDDFTCQKCGAKKTMLHAHHIIFQEDGGKDSIFNLVTLCIRCHKKVHRGEFKIAGGVSGFKDRMAQRTMQGKSYLYENLGHIALVEKVFGYQTSEYRKQLKLPKEHDVDALCVATLADGEIIDWNRENYYEINYRPRQTRRQYYSLPKKDKGRVKYQVNTELDGFRKGDIVLVKNKYQKQIRAIYSNGYLAFNRIKGEPFTAKPKDCKLIEKQVIIKWDKAA